MTCFLMNRFGKVWRLILGCGEAEILMLLYSTSGKIQVYLGNVLVPVPFCEIAGVRIHMRLPKWLK